jgi:hypothetical protein
MTALRDMKLLNAGIFADDQDYNLTSLCMTHFLDRQYKKNCTSITGVSPSAIGPLVFFQVTDTHTRTHT